LGEQDQVPPRYSAIHVDGERAYKKARRGEDAAPPPRRIRVDAIDPISISYAVDGSVAGLCLDIRCSKGTYVRSLARDIALAAGSRGRLESLERRAVGPFRLAQARQPDDMGGGLAELSPQLALDLGLAPVSIGESTALDFAQGKRINPELFMPIHSAMSGPASKDPGIRGSAARGPIAVFGTDGLFLGTGSIGDSGFEYRKVLGQ
jgi:tRNA pseudouridine55 synthase